MSINHNFGNGAPFTQNQSNNFHSLSYQNPSQQPFSNLQSLNFPEFTTSNHQPPAYLQAAYSSQLTSPYALDLNHLSPVEPINVASSLDVFHQQQPISSAREIIGRDGLSGSNSQHQYSQQQMQHSSSQQSQKSSYSQQQSMLDEQRKQEILYRLQQEREMRRRLIQEGASVQTNFNNNGGGSQQTAQFVESRAINMQQQPSQRSSQQQNESQLSSQQQMSRKDLVSKMLNERRMNRSGQVSQQNMSAYSQGGEEDEDLNFGGYNPEALYQDEVIQDQLQTNPTMNTQDNYQPQPYYLQNKLNKPSDFDSSDLTSQDQKYREAVEFTKQQIQQKRSGINNGVHFYHNHQSVEDVPQPVPQLAVPQRDHSKSQGGGSQSSRSDHSRQLSDRGCLPPNLQMIDRHIAQHSNEKIMIEMNSKGQKKNSQGSSKHHFTYDSEEDKRGAAGHDQERGFKKIATSKSLASTDYMKPTVNADLKKERPINGKTHQVLNEAQKKFHEEHTFKPQIKEYPLPVEKEQSKEERWKKLTEPKTLERQKRERIRAQIEIEETQKTCPFKPQLMPTSTKSGRSSTAGGRYDSLPLPERLLHEADLKKEKRERLKRELENEQMRNCTFKPQILSSHHSHSNTTMPIVNLDKLGDRDPIHNRVGELQKQKNEKLQKLRIQNEQEQQEKFTFQPQVNKKSEKMAIIKQNQENQNSVVDRLYRDANDRIEKQMNHNMSVNDQINKDYSFHPHISKSSNFMSAQSDMFNGNMKDFYERQETFIKRQYEKKEEARKKWADEERYSFKPEINATSEVIVESDPNRGAENDEDRIERLYKRDHKRQEVMRELIEKEVYAQYTYKPEINKVSKSIARNPTTIEELSYNPKGRQKKEYIQEQLVTQEFSECTFRPQTTKNRKYQNVPSNYTMSDCSTHEEYSRKLKEKLKEKQERIAQERREREYQMLKDCTFKPHILEREPSTQNTENVPVKGLARHLELKELKKKQEEEKRLREAEVFGLNHKFAPNIEDLDVSRHPKNNGSKIYAPTIPEPFDLTNAGRLDERRKQLLLKELKEKEMTECTFKPNVGTANEGKNKKIIKEMLNQIEINADLNDANSNRYPFQYHNYNERATSNDEKENRYGQTHHNFSQTNLNNQSAQLMMMSENNGMMLLGGQGHQSAYY